jgi:hypothetical protein
MSFKRKLCLASCASASEIVCGPKFSIGEGNTIIIDSGESGGELGGESDRPFLLFCSPGYTTSPVNYFLEQGPQKIFILTNDQNSPKDFAIAAHRPGCKASIFSERKTSEIRLSLPFSAFKLVQLGRKSDPSQVKIEIENPQINILKLFLSVISGRQMLIVSRGVRITGGITNCSIVYGVDLKTQVPILKFNTVLSEAVIDNVDINDIVLFCIKDATVTMTPSACPTTRIIEKGTVGSFGDNIFDATIRAAPYQSALSISTWAFLGFSKGMKNVRISVKISGKKYVAEFKLFSFELKVNRNPSYVDIRCQGRSITVTSIPFSAIEEISICPYFEN